MILADIILTGFSRRASVIGPAHVLLDESKFRQGGRWDLQRLSGQFDRRYIDAATVFIAIYGEAAGVSPDALLTTQSDYASVRSSWPAGTEMSDDYYLPLRNVHNTWIGYCWLDSWEAHLGSPVPGPACQ
jgi:hypothetical protein